MRILDNDHKAATRNIALYLKRGEAERLRDELTWLLRHPSLHFHVCDEDQQREISASLYEDDLLRDPDRLKKFTCLEQQMFLEG